MQIGQGETNIITGNVFSGSYSLYINSGIRTGLYALSSPFTVINNFDLPYDAELKTESGILAVGNSIHNINDSWSDRNGVFYYYKACNLFGLCHGYGQTNLTYYSGFNYYNAFYPGGYFAPPFGETLSIFGANNNGAGALNNGGCASITIDEYNQNFGIVSVGNSDANLAINTIQPGAFEPIVSVQEVCPPTIQIPSYFTEVQYNQNQGTTIALGANTFYNNNPIPTSLDNFDIKVNGRYDLVGGTGGIIFTGGRPIPSYSFQSQSNKLNNTLCLATLMETQTQIGIGQNGLQSIDAPDVNQGGVGDQANTFGADPFHYWHFIFQENAENLPFQDDYPVPSSSEPVNPILLDSQETPLFSPILSSVESYWQNRQCPSAVDFLPWTFGASIFACPSEYFDIPYYAAIRKFGFYGTRFLNSCNSLNLQYTLSGVPNATELPQSNSVYPLNGTREPGGIDSKGNSSNSLFDSLLITAKSEEQYSDMYALNKGFFLWANSGFLTGTSQYANLSTNYPGFQLNYLNLLSQFNGLFSGGFASFTGSGLPIYLSNTDDVYSVTSTTNSNILLTNDVYNQFIQNITPILTGNGMIYWSEIENQFAFYVSNGISINQQFYGNIVSGRQQRMMTRYFENNLRGNPIDLFPFNHISFSFDQASDYLESTGWARTPVSFGTSSQLPPIDRRYFEGAYGNAGAIGGVIDAINLLQLNPNTNFYPGFFNNTQQTKDLSEPSYSPILSGIILDNLGRQFSPSGWAVLGYNGVGQLKGDFSCFSPIFVQSPLPQVFCKIGQTPTFRALAVDYHTIPEDKMSARYPEILYWCQGLKIMDSDFNNLYPLQYKWYRVLKTNWDTFLANGDFSLAYPSNPLGSDDPNLDWCAFEGDTYTCTLIHPQDCWPPYDSLHTQVSDYTFIQGAIFGVDDQYNYFCLAQGRFGIRISNYSQLLIENWLRFDISFKNAMNQSNDLEVNFIGNGVNLIGDSVPFTITFKPDTDNLPAYLGYASNPYAIPERVIEQKTPPPNAGFGDVMSFRFEGMIGYEGATVSYSPDVLYDTAGTIEDWGYIINFGTLVPFSRQITQEEGNLLYGYSHLPICTNYNMENGEAGIQVQVTCGGYLVSHWSLNQQAVAALDSSCGQTFNTLNNLGELYPPIQDSSLDYDLGVGHWQWGNNLGAIKRFGYFSQPTDNDIIFCGYNAPSLNGAAQSDLINQVKQAIIKPNDLAGENCGYTPYGMGRNTLYYLEAYNRYYEICGVGLKGNQNIQDESFICPGLRTANSAIQYFWLGHPNNTYLQRKPMYGPYAYQWEVNRHNRDRNGNGISEGFYSMGYNERYSQLYDSPAIYGLYVRQDFDQNYINSVNNVNTARNALNGLGIDVMNLPSYRFGMCGTEGSCSLYGTIMVGCYQSSNIAWTPNLCNYIETAQAFASEPEFQSFGCPETALKNGECFDPCLSIRYAQGFFPGGKQQNMFNYQNIKSANLPNPENITLVSNVNYDENNEQITNDEQSLLDSSLYFRSPINTPHARIWRQLQGLSKSSNLNYTQTTIPGISPCQDGGSDHCNYITPTIHLGLDNSLIGETTAFNSIQNSITNVFIAN